MSEKSQYWQTGLAVGDSPANWGEDALADAQRYLLTDPTTQGVIQGALNGLAVTLGSGQVSVASGKAIVNGRLYTNDAALAIVTTPNPSATSRVDRIVLRANMTSAAYGTTPATPGRSVRLARLVGVEGAGTPPALTQNSNYWEIPLAKFTVAVGGALSGLVDERVYVPGIGTNANTMADARIAAQVPGMLGAIAKVAYHQSRQGGDATSWASGGSNNYATTGSLKIQTGVHVPQTDVNSTRVDGAVTFPTPFTAVPMVLVQVLDVVSETNTKKWNCAAFIPNGMGPTINGFGYMVVWDSGEMYGLVTPPASSIRVAWMAIGV